MTHCHKRHPARPPAALRWFEDMVEHCYACAVAAKQAGRPVVGIMCEYTPRELIMAAGAVPVCLCGGSAETIPPAEEELPANLCPLIKSTYGYLVMGRNPFLDIADLVVAETTCDGKKKMFELMGRRKPMVVLELPQKPDDPDAFAHWLAEIRKLKAELERQFRVTITPRRLRKSIEAMNRERSLRLKLAALMKAASPPLTGRELLDMKSIIACLPADMTRYERALHALRGRRPRPSVRSPVRVLLTGVPTPHGAERVVDLIENSGGLIVCQENCTGVKPLLENVDERADDPLEALAAKYFHLPCSVMTPNDGRLDSLRRLTGEYQPDCVVELVWHACLTYSVESALVKTLAEKELGLPCLRIETDYSPSDSARIAVRVEALFETVRASRGTRRRRTPARK